MAEHVCPPFMGYFLLTPMRKWFENPDRLFGPFVKPGMTVLEPGCAMGFFTLPLARMVGAEGRVVAVDIQPVMLKRLEKRAARAGLAGRIDCRLAGSDGLGLDDLAGGADFAAAFHVVHEVPDAARFFAEIFAALRPGGRLLVSEPKGHVKAVDFEATRRLAEAAGFVAEDHEAARAGLRMLLRKP